MPLRQSSGTQNKSPSVLRTYPLDSNISGGMVPDKAVRDGTSEESLDKWLQSNTLLRSSRKGETVPKGGMPHQKLTGFYSCF
jgi:hypothetical protein